jgi:ABC-type uncharacterized transport system permease subunit
MTILLNGLAAAGYGATAAVCVANGRNQPLKPQWLGLAAASWLVHAVALGAAFAPADPRFGWSLALSIAAWLLVAIYSIENRVLTQVRIPHAVWWFAALACLLVVLVPPRVQPATSAGMWFTAHWVFGLAAYALFGAALLHGAVLWRSEQQLLSTKRPLAPGEEQDSMPLMTVEKLMLRFTWAGFVLLSLSVLLGVVLAESLTGRALKADHKTVFSVLAWAVFAGLLVANHVIGLRGKRAVKWLAAGSVMLLLAYVGSRFVLDVLLQR